MRFADNHGEVRDTMCRSVAIVPDRVMLVLLLSGTLLSAARSSHAQTSAERREGSRFYDQGYAAFQALDYANALPLFQRAFVLTRDAAMLYNIAATLERLGRQAEAATALRRYLAANPTASNRAEIEAHVAELEQHAPASTAPVASSAAPVASSVAPVASAAPLASPSPASSAPLHTVTVVQSSRPIWPWIVLTAGVLVSVGGGVLIAVGPEPNAAAIRSERDYLGAVNTANIERSVGIALAGVGVAAIAVAVIGAVTYHPAQRSSLAWSVMPGPDGMMITFGMRGRGL